MLPSIWSESWAWKSTPRLTPTPSYSPAHRFASQRLQTPWCLSSMHPCLAHYPWVLFNTNTVNLLCLWWLSCQVTSLCASPGAEQTVCRGSGDDGTGSQLFHKQEVVFWQETLLLRWPPCEFSAPCLLLIGGRLIAQALAGVTLSDKQQHSCPEHRAVPLLLLWYNPSSASSFSITTLPVNSPHREL